MTSPQDIILGIDLGTTYSCAAFVKDGHPRIIPSEKGYATIPSVVALTRKGEIVTGHAALDHLVVDPGSTIYGAKRLVGRKFNSMLVQEIKQVMSYSIVEGDDGEAAVLLGGKTCSLSQISAYILSEIRDVAQGVLGQKITKAAITVPAYYSDNQRVAVKKAGALAGLQVEKIVNEPTAAAVAYGLNRGLNKKILIYDFGGGTFDVSVLHVRGNQFKVLATGGDTFLGGVDIDNRLTAFALRRFTETMGKDLSKEIVAVQRVRQAAERVKRELSEQNEAELVLPYITEIHRKPVDMKLAVTREQLNRFAADLVTRTLMICDQVLSSIQMRKSDIEEILLVGGQTRMPLVQERVEEHFEKSPRKGVHPDEVVALGAAILGNPIALESEVRLRDVLSIPIGIALPGGKFRIILDRNTPLPASKAYKVTVKREEMMVIDVYQGEHPKILHNEYLGTFSFPLPKPGANSEASYEMRFDLSPECLLTVKVRDVKTGDRKMVRMTTVQTPKSLQEGLKAAMAEKGTKEQSWFATFSKKILRLKS